jgi:hypothetical protein
MELSPGRARQRGTHKAMRYAGLLVMPTGFLLCIAALLLFPASVPRTIFVLSGLAVEFLGLTVTIRGHVKLNRDMRL